MEIPPDIWIYQIVPFLNFKELASFESTCTIYHRAANVAWYNLLDKYCPITLYCKEEKHKFLPFARSVFAKIYKENPWEEVPTGVHVRKINKGRKCFLYSDFAYHGETMLIFQQWESTPFVKAYKLLYFYQDLDPISETCSNTQSCNCEYCLIGKFRLITRE